MLNINSRCAEWDAARYWSPTHLHKTTPPLLNRVSLSKVTEYKWFQIAPKGAALIINDIDYRMFSVAQGMRSKIWENIKSETTPNNKIYFHVSKTPILRITPSTQSCFLSDKKNSLNAFLIWPIKSSCFEALFSYLRDTGFQWQLNELWSLISE